MLRKHVLSGSVLDIHVQQSWDNEILRNLSVSRTGRLTAHEVDARSLWKKRRFRLQHHNHLSAILLEIETASSSFSTEFLFGHRLVVYPLVCCDSRSRHRYLSLGVSSQSSENEVVHLFSALASLLFVLDVVGDIHRGAGQRDSLHYWREAEEWHPCEPSTESQFPPSCDAASPSARSSVLFGSSPRPF